MVVLSRFWTLRLFNLIGEASLLSFDTTNEGARAGFDVSGGKNLIFVGGPGHSRFDLVHCPQQGHI